MYLVTGAGGQLGAKLREVLTDAVFTDITELDISDKEAVDAFIKINNFSAIINCAAYSDADAAEDDTDKAVAVNVFGPANLAATGLPVVHISTSDVFKGKTRFPYTEEDNASPDSVFGGTRLRGEYQILDNADTAFVIRVSWLYSEDGSYVKNILDLAKADGKIDAAIDELGTPTYAGDLAAFIAEILPKLEKGKKEIYHYANEGVCSKYDFAYELVKAAGIECEVNPVEEVPCKAPRPVYSVLNKNKAKLDFGVKIAHWREGLERCAKNIKL